MYGLIDYYEPLEPSNAAPYERGSLWWTCYPYQFKSTEVTRFWPDRPTEILDVRRFDPRHESSDDSANTSKDEFLAISRFKPRPVIILSTAGTPFTDRGWRGGDFFLVAPMRSLRDSWTREYRSPPRFVWNTIAYMYSSVFYLPHDDESRVREAVIHFDWMTTLHRSWLLESRNTRLTKDAMVCLDEWLHNYLYGSVSARFGKDLESYRQALGDSPQIRTGIFGN
jgi:hypothetical protein